MKLIAISDLHLGHLKTETIHIVDRLYRYLFPNLNEKIFLVIAGDIFDFNLSLSNSDTHVIIEFFISLFSILEKHHSYLRIVRGTYNHDRNQIKAIYRLYQAKKYTFSFKYFDNVSIETINKLGINICYLPDDLQFDESSSVIFHISQMMEKQGINKFDYVIGHGSFKHVFPQNLKVYPKITYEISQFKNLVSKYIIFGHIHIPSNNEKMIYCGSFDRLIHGEPSKKGYFILNDLHDPVSVIFIENRDATTYIDFIYNQNVSHKNNLEKVTSLIENRFKLGTKEYLRIINCPPTSRYSLKKYIESTYQNIFVTFKRIKSINESDIEFKILEHFNLSQTKKYKIVWSHESLLNTIAKRLKEKHEIKVDKEIIESFLVT